MKEVCAISFVCRDHLTNLKTFLKLFSDILRLSLNTLINKGPFSNALLGDFIAKTITW